jgi:small-conductance mechanosensitive channel
MPTKKSKPKLHSGQTLFTSCERTNKLVLRAFGPTAYVALNKEFSTQRSRIAGIYRASDLRNQAFDLKIGSLSERHAEIESAARAVVSRNRDGKTTKITVDTLLAELRLLDENIEVLKAALDLLDETRKQIETRDSMLNQATRLSADRDRARKYELVAQVHGLRNMFTQRCDTLAELWEVCHNEIEAYGEFGSRT